jgi:hypothetical protein
VVLVLLLIQEILLIGGILLMKQLQVPIEDALMSAAKLHGFQNGITLKEVVAQALTLYLESGQQSTVKTQPKLNQDGPNITPLVPTQIEEPVQPPVEDFYPIRKTHKVGKPTHSFDTYNVGPVEWYLMDGCRPHYDKDGEVIPFRYTDETGKVLEPSEKEIKALEEYLGKPVTIEK